MHKLLSKVLLSAAAVVLLPVNAWAAAALPYQFVDIESHWAKAELTEMIQLDVLSGYAEGGKYYAKPNKAITRVEFAALMAKTLRLEASDSTPDFADWQQVPDWAKGAAAALQADGIINGVPGDDGKIYFQPNKNITRAEIAAIIVNALEQKPDPPYNVKFTDVPTDKWYSQPVFQAQEAGLISGRTASSFAPEGNATRAEVLVILNRFMKSESADAPDDEDLQEVVEDYFDDLQDVVEDGDELKSLARYTTGGAALALDMGGLGVLESTPFEGEVRSIRMIDDPKVDLKSSRVAALTGESLYKLKYGGDDISVRVAEKYGLVKIDNKWKIYSVEVLSQKVYS